MADEEIFHNDTDNSMKVSRYDVDPQYNDPDPFVIHMHYPSSFERIGLLIQMERQRQDSKWGQQNHQGPFWMLIALEEFGEVSKALLEGDTDNYILELVQTSAVLVAWLESELRRLSASGINIEDVIERARGITPKK